MQKYQAECCLTCQIPPSQSAHSFCVQAETERQASAYALGQMEYERAWKTNPSTWEYSSIQLDQLAVIEE